MPSNKSSSSSSSSSSSAGGQPATTQSSSNQSNYQMAKEGWGDRVSFQTSMGLKMTPDDIDEGNEILDAYRDADAEQNANQRK